MKCDFCDGEAILTSGYHYCAKCVKGQDRLWIHNTIVDAFPSITMTRIHQLCTEMFETESYGFPDFSRLYKILDRGPIVSWGPRRGYYAKPQAQYLVEVFEKFLQTAHPKFYDRVKGDKVERYY